MTMPYSGNKGIFTDFGWREALKGILTFRERSIVMLRWGWNGDGTIYTLEEVGIKFKITRERVRQLERKALWKIGCFLMNSDRI